MWLYCCWSVYWWLTVVLFSLFVQEYRAWLVHHQELMLNESETATLAELTGAVPGYLSMFLAARKDQQAASAGEAMHCVARDLALEVKTKFSKFRTDELFWEAAEALVRGEPPTTGQDHWDHNFFYADRKKSYAVCGVAARVLVELLRKHGKGAVVLSPENIATCKAEGNRWVQAYRAEDIVISAISKYGFSAIKDESHTNVKSVPFSKVSHLALNSRNSGAYQCIPPAGFEFLDSVIVVIPSNKKQAVKIFAQQTTFSSVADHKASRNFFDKEHKVWEDQFPLKTKFQWHLVWVLTANEKGLRHKAGEHGRTNKEKERGFVEWFFSFADFEPALDL